VAVLEALALAARACLRAPCKLRRLNCVPLIGVCPSLQVHLRDRPVADDINLRELAFETQRYSGAQLANLVNIAASIAGKEGRDAIAQDDLLRVTPILLFRARRDWVYAYQQTGSVKNWQTARGPFGSVLE
jgi:cell division protease FtsH